MLFNGVPLKRSLWTGEPPTAEPTDHRGAMMPKRRHTRAANTATAKTAERRLNDPSSSPNETNHHSI